MGGHRVCVFVGSSLLQSISFQVVKNRFSGDLGTMPLYFNRPTLTFSKKIYQKERSQTKSKPKKDSSSVNQSGLSSSSDPVVTSSNKSGFVIEDEQGDEDQMS